MKKLGQSPLFPIKGGIVNNLHIDSSFGMSQRLFLVGMAMQGLLMNPERSTYTIEANTQLARSYVDELFKQENEDSPQE